MNRIWPLVAAPTLAVAGILALSNGNTWVGVISLVMSAVNLVAMGWWLAVVRQERHASR